MESYTFCAEMREVKALLTDILSTLGGSSDTDDLMLQYPPDPDDLPLEAGATYEDTVNVNRRLRYLCVSVPANCIMRILNNHICVLWFTDEAGTLELPTGYQMGEMQIVVENVGNDDCRWSLRAIFV